MRHIEIIRLRTSSTAAPAELARLVAELRSGSAEVTLLAHTVVEGDFAIVLRCEDAATGQLIAEALRAFGLVDHSTWQAL